MIWVFDSGRLMLICSAKDWKLFLPSVPEIIWTGYAHDERWTWCWAPERALA